MTDYKATPTRVGRFTGQHPLCAGDIRRIARRLDELGYPDSAPAEIVTPLPPKNRRIVDIIISDYTNNEGNQKL